MRCESPTPGPPGRRFPPAAVRKHEQFQVAWVAAQAPWDGSGSAWAFDVLDRRLCFWLALEKHRSVFYRRAALPLSSQVMEERGIGLVTRAAKSSKAPPVADRCQYHPIDRPKNVARFYDRLGDHRFDPDFHLFRLLSPKRPFNRLR